MQYIVEVRNPDNEVTDTVRVAYAESKRDARLKVKAYLVRIHQGQWVTGRVKEV